MQRLERVHESYYRIGFANFEDPDPQTEAPISTLSPEVFAKIAGFLTVVRKAICMLKTVSRSFRIPFIELSLSNEQ